MVDLEALYFIRDEMLTDFSLDVTFIYGITKLAETEYDTYHLMSSWIKEVDQQKKLLYIERLKQNLDYYNTVGVANDERSWNC